MVISYGIICLISLLLVWVCRHVDKKHDRWLFLLFVSVFVCNLGYFLISFADSLEFALMANRVAYLGNVFLPYYIFMIIAGFTTIRLSPILVRVLGGIGGVVLLITVSQGILPFYYSEVSFELVGNVGHLVRTYGPLHFVYALYLAGYFVLTLTFLLVAIFKKKMVSKTPGGFLLAALALNIGVWFFEKFIPRQFEFLSISYVVTEVFLLLLYALLREYGLRDIRAGFSENLENGALSQSYPDGEETAVFSQREIDSIFAGCEEISKLSGREKEVLRYILTNRKRKEIAEELYVTESTIKKHTAQIFQKLSVSSRMELYLKLRAFRK